MAGYPKDLYGHYLPLLIQKEYPDICASRGIVYVDTWPLASPMLAVYDPSIINQFTTEDSRPKHELVLDGFHILTQGLDIFTAEGSKWKVWRKVFNPGFAPQNIMSFVPAILEEVQVFRAWLDQVAKEGGIVEMQEPAEKLTIDVISRVVL